MGRVGDRKYAMTGLAHMSLDRGKLYELVLTDGKWTAQLTLDIGSCPEIFLLVDQDLYLATSISLLVIRDGKLKNTLVKDAFWWCIYPNFMVYANRSLFIGMRGGVYTYDLDTKAETWYDFLSESEKSKDSD